MKVLIVYDSVYGNTEKVARVIGNEFTGQGEEITVIRADSVEPAQLAGVDLLIVGGPTVRLVATGPVTAFLGRIPGRSLKGVKVATFDTRLVIEELHVPILTFLTKIFHCAADQIAVRLKRKGGELIAAPEGFYVKDAEGPLKDGELERAAAWAKSLIKA